MSKYWNNKINSIEPYKAGEQPKPGQKVIKLNTNENPYPPSPECLKAITSFDIDKLRLYPDTDSTGVRDAVAENEGISRENVFVGNGSDEILALCWQTFWEKAADTDKPVLIPEISYSFYPVYSDFYDVRVRKIPLREDFVISPDDYIGVPNAGIAIANPNAPTSRVIPLDDIRKILDNNPDSVVLVDEAYAAFATGYTSAATLIGEYGNIVVVRTLSKSYGLAGMRMGYAIASEELIDGLKRARDSFNSYPSDRISQAIGEAALRDREYFEKTRAAVIATRERTMKELTDLGFTMPPSAANFIFAKPPVGNSAEKLYNTLKDRGILVRFFDKPLINEYLRISIGTDEEMDRFIEVVKEELANGQNS